MKFSIPNKILCQLREHLILIERLKVLMHMMDIQRFLDFHDLDFFQTTKKIELS